MNENQVTPQMKKVEGILHEKRAIRYLFLP